MRSRSRVVKQTCPATSKGQVHLVAPRTETAHNEEKHSVFHCARFWFQGRESEPTFVSRRKRLLGGTKTAAREGVAFTVVGVIVMSRRATHEPTLLPGGSTVAGICDGTDDRGRNKLWPTASCCFVEHNMARIEAKPNQQVQVCVDQQPPPVLGKNVLLSRSRKHSSPRLTPMFMAAKCWK